MNNNNNNNEYNSNNNNNQYNINNNYDYNFIIERSKSNSNSIDWGEEEEEETQEEETQNNNNSFFNDAIIRNYNSKSTTKEFRNIEKIVINNNKILQHRYKSIKKQFTREYFVEIGLFIKIYKINRSDKLIDCPQCYNKLSLQPGDTKSTQLYKISKRVSLCYGCNKNLICFRCAMDSLPFTNYPHCAECTINKFTSHITQKDIELLMENFIKHYNFSK